MKYYTSFTDRYSLIKEMIKRQCITKCRTLKHVLVYFIVLLVLIMLLKISLSDNSKRNNVIKSTTEQSRINLIFTICSNEQLAMEAIVMMKSAIIFRNSLKLHFIAFTDDKIRKNVTSEIEKLKSLSPNAFTYEIRNVTHTKNPTPAMWKCSMERLYFSEILSKIDRALYVDVDTLFTNDLTDIWNQFELMNSSQLCGVARDTVNPYWSLYRNLKNGRIPHFADGLNSGVLLMDLKKMREYNWTSLVDKAFKDFDGKEQLCDQDVVNIIFHYNPDKILLLPCRFNANDLHFSEIDFICTDAIRHGLSIMHGTGHRFFNRDLPHLHRFYECFMKYKIGTNVYENLSKPLFRELANLPRGVGNSILHFYLEANGILSPIKMNHTT